MEILENLRYSVWQDLIFALPAEYKGRTPPAVLQRSHEEPSHSLNRIHVGANGPLCTHTTRPTCSRIGVTIPLYW